MSYFQVRSLIGNIVEIVQVQNSLLEDLKVHMIMSMWWMGEMKSLIFLFPVIRECGSWRNQSSIQRAT